MNKQRQWVYRIWARIEQLTGQPPVYLDASNVAACCPRCLEGTIRIRFLHHPAEGILITSNTVSGGCSFGCFESEIAEVLFA